MSRTLFLESLPGGMPHRVGVTLALLACAMVLPVPVDAEPPSPSTFSIVAADPSLDAPPPPPGS